MSDIRVIVTDDLKSDAEAILKELDLTMSQAVRMFLKQVVKRKELPFNPYQRIYNAETIQAIENTQNNKNLSTFNNLDEMFNDWDKEDS